MSPLETEEALKRHGGKPWHQYKRRKEGFIASVIEGNFKAGKPVSRKEAQELWFARMDKEQE